MAAQRRVDLAIVGGGIIGLASAWRARQRGIEVTLLERGRLAQGASRVAAGMLAPVAEVEFGESGRRLLQLGLRSAEMWPTFAAALQEASGVEVPLLRTGTLLLARDADEAGELERQLEFRRSLGLGVRRLLPAEARELEPALAPRLRLALEAPDDHSLEPRAALAALARACELAGVELREHARVASVELDADTRRVTGVRLDDGELVAAEHVLLASGAWAQEIGGLPSPARMPVRPVKGQIMRLRDPAGAGLLTRVVRYEGGYVVPRGDGRYVLGATVEERRFEALPTVGGVYELLRDAHELLPGLGELELEELSVGFRPGTPDNAPVIGAGALEGLLWAGGHHRNGILLAPLTAQLIAGLLDPSAAPEDAPALLHACDPARFAPALAGAPR